MRPVLLLACVLVALAGCMKKTETTTPAASADSVTALARTLHYETADCRTLDQPCLRLDLTYPVLLHVPGGDTLALNRDLRRRLNSGTYADSLPVYADPDSLLRTRLASFERPLPNHAPWFDSTAARVTHFAPGALTLSIFDFSYAGGAHPNTVTVYAVLDPATAHEVPLDSVLVPGARPRLIGLVEEAFRAARGMAADSSFADAGFWFKGRFELTPNWGMTADGLVFHYNAYEVGPYVMGATTAVVPWAKLAGVLRPRYLPA
jgi:hypothetical protein